MLEAKVTWTTKKSTDESNNNNNHGKETISCVDFNHDGTEVALCRKSDKRISIYQCCDGTLLQQLRGHKGTIFTLSYSKPVAVSNYVHVAKQVQKKETTEAKNMLLLASGGGDDDRTTILWDTNYGIENGECGGTAFETTNRTNEGLHVPSNVKKKTKGMVKFAHGSSVQCVIFHPTIPNLLASVSKTDFAFWSPNDTTVRKYSLLVNESTNNEGNDRDCSDDDIPTNNQIGTSSNIRAAAWSTLNMNATSNGGIASTSNNYGNELPILILGLQSGVIHVRDIYGQCIYHMTNGSISTGVIRRAAPIIDMKWFVKETANDNSDSDDAVKVRSVDNDYCGTMGGLLVVASWDRIISLYSLSKMNPDVIGDNGIHDDADAKRSRQQGMTLSVSLLTEYQLNYYPCTISSYVSVDCNEEFILVAGSKCGIDVFNLKGINVMTLTLKGGRSMGRVHNSNADCDDSGKGISIGKNGDDDNELLQGIWCVRSQSDGVYHCNRDHERNKSVASLATMKRNAHIACVNMYGTLTMLQVSSLDTCNRQSRWGDHLAYRHHGTDVIIRTTHQLSQPYKSDIDVYEENYSLNACENDRIANNEVATISFPMCVRQVIMAGDFLAVVTVDRMAYFYKKTHGDSTQGTLKTQGWELRCKWKWMKEDHDRWGMRRDGRHASSFEAMVLFPFSSSLQIIIVLGKRVELHKMVLEKDHRISEDHPNRAPREASMDLLQEWHLPEEASSVCALYNVTERESLLVGLIDGRVLKITMDNPFLMDMFRFNDDARYVGGRTKVKSIFTNISTSTSNCCKYIGLLDEKDQLFMYNLTSGSFMNDQQPIATGCKEGVVFHDSVESLYCFRTNNKGNSCSGDNGNLIIGYGGGIMTREACMGSIVKFKGCFIVTLYGGVLHHTRVDIVSMVQEKISEGDHMAALELAKLGVGDLVWLFLWNQSLLSLKFDIASKCLVSKSMLEMTKRLLEMASSVSHSFELKQMSHNDMVRLISAEIDIVEGRFKQAGNTFCALGLKKKAIDLFVTMKMFHDAKALVPSHDHQSRILILTMEAEWEENMCRWKDASQLHFECGNSIKAIEITGKRKYKGWVDCIVKFSRLLPSSEKDALEICCDYLSSEDGNENHIKEILIKIRDHSKLMALYVRTKAWIDVSKLFEKHKDSFDHSLLVPYADWLAAQGNLSMALVVNRSAHQSYRNMNLLSFLIKDALSQECYSKASSLYLTMAKEVFIDEDSNHMSKGTGLCTDRIVRSSEMHVLAMVYHVWDRVRDYISGSFLSSVQPRVALQSCAYLLNTISPNSAPQGIEFSLVLETFIDIAKRLNAFHPARVAYERYLGHTDEMTIDMLELEASPDDDDDDLCPVCFRCGSSNDLLRKGECKGDSCQVCLHPFIRCTLTLDVLPLVEFSPVASLSNEEVSCFVNKFKKGNEYRGKEDLFHIAINNSLTDAVTIYSPVKVNEKILKNFHASDVYIIEDANTGETKYYKNMIPDIGIAVCNECCKFFHDIEYEFAFLRDGGCPYCDIK